jgi:copper/silver efflux system protein
MALGEPPGAAPRGPVQALIGVCLGQKLFVVIGVLGAVFWGLLVAPLDWELGGLPRSPVPVDAIPDIGENQQILFSEWPGRSPQDIDDQISYPLTVALLGVPGVRDVRSYSLFGFSSIYVIFDERVDFYWSRSRLLEKLNSLPAGTLPAGVTPALGPDATALGQVFWYTLEGQDRQGNPTGGWDLDELRSIQDYIVRYRLSAVEGVAEVASIGGFVREYQVDVDPDALRASGVTLAQVVDAVRHGNLDVGARTIEVNRVEYLVRGIGLIRSVQDLEAAAVSVREGRPILLRDVARVTLGPALRRGVLTKAGAETVGGVVVVRFGENPMATIQRVRAAIAEAAPGLPAKTLADGTESRVTVVPFYDRTGLIRETLGTLNAAISQQVLVTIAVVVLMVLHLRSSLLIGAMLPLAVLMTFIGMRLFRVDANIVALSGIAIAIGTIVDMGIVLTENILRRLEEAAPEEPRLQVIHRASAEVGGAVLTAVATTIVSFLPVFTMEAAEGKLFRPLAYTKTFALLASIILTLTVLPAAAHVLLGMRLRAGWGRVGAALLLLLGLAVAAWVHGGFGAVLIVLGAFQLARPRLRPRVARALQLAASALAVLLVLWALALAWEPAGPERGVLLNVLFIAVFVGGVIGLFWLVRLAFPHLLWWSLQHKLTALLPATLLVLSGLTVWLGFERTWGWLPEGLRRQEVLVDVAHAFPGLGSEFMPSLDEGAFLYMPSAMPHVSIGEATDIVQELDRRIMSVPEVELAVGKIGRAESPLDPAPIMMIETLIQYRSEYRSDAAGRRLSFRVDARTGEFVRDEQGELVPDRRGRPFRQWRPHIRSADDIWAQIAAVTEMPGVTGAPRLQPIETRVVMLQSGFRAPMGIKVYGPDLERIEAFALELERLLREVPSVQPEAVFADRIVGKPYLEIHVDREAIARYGLSMAAVQEVIEVALGGRTQTMTVEGRERYPVRVRYLRELRDQPETLGDVLVATPMGVQVPLRELARIEYRRGPQMIRSENTFLSAYVLFDRRPGVAEVSVVEEAQALIGRNIASGELRVPAGVSFEFAGSYKNQLRAAERLRLVLPISLVLIFLLLYLRFKSVAVTLTVFSGVFVAWSGGFLMLWLYAQPWFLDVHLLGVHLRELFGVRPFNLSIAVWVGFLALFGIATDDGVIMGTRIEQSLAGSTLRTRLDVRRAVLEGGRLRIRAAAMTSATTILALLPVLTSTGRGADVMIPMAIPAFGGMVFASITWFVVPVLHCWAAERRHRPALALQSGPAPPSPPRGDLA